MYKIRKENEKFIIYQKVDIGHFNQSRLYKINLTDKEYSYFEGNEEYNLEWSEIEDTLQERMPEFKKLLKEKIENNKRVYGSTRMEGNEKEMNKAAKHLKENREILEYLENNY